MVKVKFNRNYIATRGPGISGTEGCVCSLPMTEALQELIGNGTVELVKETKAGDRKKATGKKGAEKS